MLYKMEMSIGLVNLLSVAKGEHRWKRRVAQKLRR